MDKKIASRRSTRCDKRKLIFPKEKNMAKEFLLNPISVRETKRSLR